MKKNIFYFMFQSKQFERNRNKNIFRLRNLLNFIVLMSKLLLQKMPHVTIHENIVRRKEMIITFFLVNLVSMHSESKS